MIYIYTVTVLGKNGLGVTNGVQEDNLTSFISKVKSLKAHKAIIVDDQCVHRGYGIDNSLILNQIEKFKNSTSPSSIEDSFPYILN